MVAQHLELTLLLVVFLVTDASATPAFEVHGGNLSMTGNRIVNLAPGIDGTDGVNIDQLKAARTKSYIQ